MNTGSSVSKGTSNFFIHIVIGAMLVGTLKKKKNSKDLDIQRNRKFGHGRECFAPPSPYLWGCSKYNIVGNTLS